MEKAEQATYSKAFEVMGKEFVDKIVAYAHDDLEYGSEVRSEFLRVADEVELLVGFMAKKIAFRIDYLA